MGGIGVTTNPSQSTSSGLLWDFDSPASDPEHANTNSMADFVASSADPLALEYSIAPGDSGGGSYIFENSQWYLAGVTSGDVDYFTYPDIAGSNRDTYGDLNLVTRVAAYQSFIDNLVPTAVPEPGHWALICSGLAIAVIRCRRKNQGLTE